MTRRTYPDDPMSPILLAVDARRRELGMTQRDLAEECGTQQSHISAVLSGRTSVSLPVLERMCLAVGLRLTTAYVGGSYGPFQRPRTTSGRQLSGHGLASATERHTV